MKKNVAGQVVVAQLVSKTDGSAVTTGTTSVYLAGDGGVQSLMTTGSPEAQHLGNGVWAFYPSAGETNYDHVAFTFVNSSAVNATIQIYTSFPQTGDNYARIGAATGSPTAQTITDDLLSISNRLPAALVSGRMDSSVGAMAANVLTASAIASDAITDAKVASDVTIASVTGAVGSVTGAVGSVTGAVGSVTGNVGGNVTGSVGSVVGAVGSVTGNVGGNVTGSVGSVAAGGITASSFAADAITAAKIAADVTTELQSGLATSASISTLQTSVDDLPTNAELATALGTADDAVLAQVALVKAVTDKLDGLVEAGSPAGYEFTATALQNAPSGSGASAASIADAVWDEAIAGHVGAGSTGEALSDAGAAGNPWNNTAEGSFTFGDLVKIMSGVAAGKTDITDNGNGTATVVFRSVIDDRDILTAAMTSSERTTVTLNP